MNTINRPSQDIRSLGRVDTSQAAGLLGFQAFDIPILIRARLLKPLGNPAPNAPRYFARVEIERLAADPAWLDRATKACTQHWKNKNSRRTAKVANRPRAGTRTAGSLGQEHFTANLEPSIQEV